MNAVNSIRPSCLGESRAPGEPMFVRETGAGDVRALQTATGASIAALRPYAPDPLGLAQTVSRRQRALSIGAALLVQATFIAAWIYGATFEVPPQTEPMVMVALMEETKVEAPPPPPVAPRLMSPMIVLDVPVLPEIAEPPVAPSPARDSSVITTTDHLVASYARANVENFQATLLRHLNAHKHYPSVARAKRQQGVVYVRFAMDRQGHVLSAAIAKASRHAVLDGEGLALISRAQPLPLPPAEIAGDSIELIVPVEFSLR